MADEPEVFGVDKRDWPDLADLLRWWRAMRDGGSADDGPRRQLGVTVYAGKPNTAFSKGALAAPNNVVSIWIGPAWGAESADTGRDVEADYAGKDFAAGDWVSVTRIGGKWYVAPLECAD